jgi:hypothetical protein
MVDQKHASFTDFSKGGFIDDVDATWLNTKFAMYDYQGKADPAPAFIADVMVDGDEEPHQQAWSCGAAKDWEPSPDGKFLVPARDGVERIRQNTKFAILMKSLIDAGFPKDALGSGDAGVFEGIRVHMIQIPAPEYRGLDKPKKTGKDGKEYAATIPVVSAVLEVAATSGKKGKKGSTTAAGGADEGSSVEEAAVAILTGMLMEAGGSLKKTQIPTLAVKNADLKSDPNKTVIMKKMFEDKFLTKNFTFADGTVSLKE